MEQWVSLITLFVSDLEKPAAFHSVLGWQRELGEEGVVAFNLIGQTLGLYPRADLAVGFGIPTAAIGRFSGIFLSYNTPQKSEVAPLLERVAKAGGQIIKFARDVIWGGSRGIGLGCAVALAEAGAHVVICARDPDQLAEATDQMRAKGHSAEHISLDVTDLDATRAAIADQRYDIMVNSAGVARHSAALDTQADDFDAVIAMNIRAAYFWLPKLHVEWLGEVDL